MRYGVTCFVTDQTIGITELAQAIEERGFDSLYLPEHTHIPTSRATPAPMGEPLPHYYARCVDPFVALAAAAAVTTRIRLGTGICLVAQRDAIVTAKEVATLDLLSGGRFAFGVGYGWNREEAEDHAVAFDERRDVVHDKLRAMRVLWTQEVASYDGAHVRFDATWQWPKPARHVPVLLGVAPGPRNYAALIELADGWIPIGGRGLSTVLPELRAALEAAGRDPDAFEVVPFGSTPDAAKFEHFARLGVSEIVANAPSAPRDDVLAWLDDYAAVLAQLR